MQSPFIPHPVRPVVPPGAQTVPLVSVEGPRSRGTKITSYPVCGVQTVWAHHDQAPTVTLSVQSLILERATDNLCLDT